MQQAILDSTGAQSLAQEQAADTTGALRQLEQNLGEAGDLLLTGELGESGNVLYQGLTGFVVEQGPKVLSALALLVFLYAIYRLVFWLLARGMRRARYIRAGLVTLVLQAVRLVGLTVVFMTVLGHLGVNLAGLGLGLGLAGVAVGFAARDTLENIISGVTILLDQPFRIGDKIIIQGTYGTVMEITLRSTRLRTPNNEILVMPNLQMVNNQLLNHAMISPLRVDIPFGIAYKEHPHRARDVVLALTRQDDRLHTEHPARVKVTNLGESSIDMVLWLFLHSPDHEMAVQYDYKERIREALREAGIEIPFPHLQLKTDGPLPASLAP